MILGECRWTYLKFGSMLSVTKPAHTHLEWNLSVSELCARAVYAARFRFSTWRDVTHEYVVCCTSYQIHRIAFSRNAARHCFLTACCGVYAIVSLHVHQSAAPRLVPLVVHNLWYYGCARSDICTLYNLKSIFPLWTTPESNPISGLFNAYVNMKINPKKFPEKCAQNKLAWLLPH